MLVKLLWLADELRAAGLTVVEHAGWRDRVIPGSWSPRFGVVHATAGPRSQPDADQIAIVRDGRKDLPGPIGVACVDHGGRWHVLGAGRCNTTIAGTAGPYKGLGNTYALGVEACNDNRGEPWPRVQYESYYRGWAAICRRLGWTERNLVGHKEHTPGHKTDPSFDMDQFRRDVARVLAGGEEDPMAALTDAEKKKLFNELHDIWYILWQGATKADGTRTDSRAYWYGLRENLNETLTLLRQLADRPPLDPQVIADRVLAGLGGTDLREVATALRAALGTERAADLGELLVSGAGASPGGQA